MVLTKESAKALASSDNSATAQLGLGASIGGVAVAAAKTIQTSATPPAAKVALVNAGAAAGGLVHLAGTSILRSQTANSAKSLPSSNSSSDSDPSNINNGPSSPYESD